MQEGPSSHQVFFISPNCKKWAPVRVDRKPDAWSSHVGLQVTQVRCIENLNGSGQAFVNFSLQKAQGEI